MNIILPIALIVSILTAIGFVTLIIVLINTLQKHGGIRGLKGEIGENVVFNYLNNRIEEEHLFLNDIIIKDEKGSHQIDHILLTKKGIFVIETKNYSGSIFGNESDQKWMQVLAYGNTKNQFYNPIMQNITHLNVIKRLLKIDDHIYSLIIFPKAKMLQVTSTSFVGYLKESLSYIKYILENNNDIFSSDDLNNFYISIDNANNKNENRKEEHINYLNERKDKISKGICPYCGGKLILRKGKYGEFYGCSNYPKCHFKTKDLN